MPLFDNEKQFVRDIRLGLDGETRVGTAAKKFFEAWNRIRKSRAERSKTANVVLAFSTDAFVIKRIADLCVDDLDRVETFLRELPAKRESDLRSPQTVANELYRAASFLRVVSKDVALSDDVVRRVEAWKELWSSLNYVLRKTDNHCAWSKKGYRARRKKKKKRS